MFELKQGDCLDVLKTLPDNSVDAVVTDPPYELGFMGKGWDSTGIANNPALWAEAMRVLKPGGHLASFSSTRTYHRIACAIEDAGFEVRDQLAWVYGQGFPKSLDVSKAIDKAAGAEREVVGFSDRKASLGSGEVYGDSIESTRPTITAPATDAARQWNGWGTALKPAWEPICLARKPLSEKTVAANVLRWGTGAINVDGCRIENGDYDPSKVQRQQSNRKTWEGGEASGFAADHEQQTYNAKGRFPANLCHDGSDEVLDLFPETKSGTKHGGDYGRDVGVYEGGQRHDGTSCFADSGSAARFFYCAKASKADRALSKHPTVKPVKLMQWLCRLLTPPGGVVLDPFAGSGTTGAAAILEGFRPILIEREDEYVADIRRRLGLHGASDAVITHDTLGEVA